MIKPMISSMVLAGLLLGNVSACQTANVTTIDDLSTPEGHSPADLRTLSAPTTAELSQLRESELPAANRMFSFSLFQDLLQAAPNENLFVSPLSVSMALSMLYNGARGETQQEIAQALAYQDLSLEAINQGQLILRKRLQHSGKGVEVRLANALWGKEGFSFQSEFLTHSKRFYDGRLESLPFESQSAVDRINQWASDNTKGLIPEVVKKIDPQTILLLMNAIYFKGSWSTPFEVSQTQDLPFYKTDNSSSPQPMMARYGEWRYAELENTQIVSLPYGNKRTEMLVFLPQKGQALASWAASLNAERWAHIQNALRSRDGRVTLPKFEIKKTLDLKEALKRLGMVNAFSESEANLDGLLADPAQSNDLRPFVGDVKQDTFIEVNEEGTEAAAVTSVAVFGYTSASPAPFEMIMDRPFVYVIYDRDTESLLFMGAFNTPTN